MGKGNQQVIPQQLKFTVPSPEGVYWGTLSLSLGLNCPEK